MISRTDWIAVGFLLLTVAVVIMAIKKLPVKKLLIITVFSGYIIILISIVFFPIFYAGRSAEVGYNFVPFASIRNYILIKKSYSVTAILGNVILLIPWGFMFKAVFTKCKTFMFFILTFTFCAGIETIQHLINIIIGYRGRCVDIDDFILNFSGAVIGYLLYFIFDKTINRIKTLSR